MQFLGVSPSAAVAVFSKVIHHQAHIFQMADTRFRVPKPKAFGMAAHQLHRTLAQFRRSRRRWRHFAQLLRFGSHETNVRMIPAQGKESLFRSAAWPSAFRRLAAGIAPLYTITPADYQSAIQQTDCLRYVAFGAGAAVGCFTFTSM